MEEKISDKCLTKSCHKNDSALAKVSNVKVKRRGGGFIEALRKLTPPKRAASRSSSGNSTTRSRTSSGNLDSPFFSTSTESEQAVFFPAEKNFETITETSPETSLKTSHKVTPATTPKDDAVTTEQNLYSCPAQNCHLKLSRDEVLSHVTDRHCMVTSEDPEYHSNSIEVAEGDMVQGEGAAAWAPTLLTAFDQTFFFETWRNANGQWFMWVYHLGYEDISTEGEFVSDIEIQKGEFKATFSGPVFSLIHNQNKVTSSGQCLSFTDNLAKVLLQSLGDGATGINYTVRVRRAMNLKLQDGQ